MLTAYILVSFTLFVMARFSPYEWNNPHPCDTENDVMENQFSISNSFWFITGTFLRQAKFILAILITLIEYHLEIFDFRDLDSTQRLPQQE